MNTAKPIIHALMKDANPSMQMLRFETFIFLKSNEHVLYFDVTATHSKSSGIKLISVC